MKPAGSELLLGFVLNFLACILHVLAKTVGGVATGCGEHKECRQVEDNEYAVFHG